jgi:uncharacterized membrane protein
MADIASAIQIAAPANLVFAFFVPQRMPYWYGAEMQSCFEVQDGAAEFALGLKVRISGRLGRREVTHAAVVTRYEWGRALEWRFQDAYGVRGLESWELGAAGEGTRVRMCSRYDMPGRLAKLMDWLVTRHAVARRNRDALARLQRLAQRG